MNLYLLVCPLILGMASGFSLIKHAHMLQQNSYFPSRYLSWLKGSFLRGFIFGAILFCATLVLCYFDKYFWLCIIGALKAVYCAVSNINKQKKAIKPLVYTARIKRFFAAFIVLFFIIAILAFVFTARALVFVATVFSFCVPLLVLILYAITYPLEKGIAQYYINDAKKSLKASKGLRVIGITGSFGKTGTKQILGAMLGERYNTLITPKSFNTPMGVVRTVRENLRRDTQAFVCEMGAKNKGDIKKLCKIANPSFAIITSVGAQHLETFKTVEKVASTKFELADHCFNKKDGFVLVNFDSLPARQYSKGKSVISYGTSKDCDFYINNIKTDRYGSSFTVSHKDISFELKTKLLGTHNVLNVTAGAAAAYLLGVSVEDIAFAAARLTPAEHRLETKPFLMGSIMIDDAYNSNPEGCLEAVEVLSRFGNMKKVIITPGLVELGEREAKCNADFASAAAGVCDYIIFVGKRRAPLLEPAALSAGFDKTCLYVAESFAEAVNIYKDIADSNTVVLVENDLPDNYL